MGLFGRRSGVGLANLGFLVRAGGGRVNGSEGLSVPGTIQTLPDDPVRNELLRLRIEGFGVGTWDLDLSTRKLEWSDTARSLFGVALDQPVTYELFLSLLEPKDRERTEEAIKRVAETGGNFDVSFKVGGAAASAQWIRARGG